MSIRIVKIEARPDSKWIWHFKIVRFDSSTTDDGYMVISQQSYYTITIVQICRLITVNRS